MTRTRRSRAPRRQAGHYGVDHAIWYDEHRDRWFPVAHDTEQLELTLEEAGPLPWWRGTPLSTRPDGTTWVRFVAQVAGADASGPSFRAVSGPFEHRATTTGEDRDVDPSWTPGMAAALDDLRRLLERSGWVRAGRSTRTWSDRYVRPLVDWTRPHRNPESALRDRVEEA